MERPGGALSTRPLHFIWMADCSGSMDTGGKIQSLNTAIREALPNMRRVARENPNAEVLVRVLAFADGARWVVADPTPVDDFTWRDLSAGGVTDLGKALSMVAEVLKMPPMSNRALQPVLALLSDGIPTDRWERGLDDLLAQPWGNKSIRIAIAIGRDADYEVLQRFIGDPGRRPLTANNSAELSDLIQWASTVVVRSASQPKVEQTGDVPGPVFVPSRLPMTSDIPSSW